MKFHMLKVHKYTKKTNAKFVSKTFAMGKKKIKRVCTSWLGNVGLRWKKKKFLLGIGSNFA